MKKQITLSFALFLMMHISIMAQWQSIGSGISSTPRTVFSISAVSENVVWAVAFNPSGQNAYDFTVSIDGGTTWNSGLLPDTIGNCYPGYIYALNEQTAWIIMISLPEQDKIRIFKTSDGGNAWEEQRGDFNSSGTAFAALHFFNANEGIGFGSPGTDDSSVDSLRIYRTLDGGDNWTRIPKATLPDPMQDEGVWVYGDNRYESKGDTLWFVTRASRVFRTTDRGLTWKAFDAGISGSSSSSPGLASIAFQNSMEGIVTTYLPSQAARTTDGGETWNQFPIPATPRASDIEYIPGTEATYIIHSDWYDGSFTSNKYLRTIDGGQIWDTITFSPAIKVVKFLSPTIGFGGSKVLSPESGGLYKWVGDFTSSIRNVSKRELVIEVYPNPANETITIGNLPSGSIVEINDITGLKVYGSVIEQGQISVNISDFTSGIYIIHVTDKGSYASRKLVIKR